MPRAVNMISPRHNVRVRLPSGRLLPLVMGKALPFAEHATHNAALRCFQPQRGVHSDYKCTVGWLDNVGATGVTAGTAQATGASAGRGLVGCVERNGRPYTGSVEPTTQAKKRTWAWLFSNLSI